MKTILGPFILSDPVKRLRRLAVLAVAVLVVGGLGVYCARTAEQVSGLYTELRQLRRLRGLQAEYLSAMDANRKLLEDFRPKVMPLEDMTAAIVNLSTRLEASGLTETYCKLEQREVIRDTDGVTGVCRVIVEGTGAYTNALDFLNALTNDKYYYFLENVKITAEDTGGIRLRAACVIAGFGEPGAAAPEPPRGVLFRDPFEG